MSDNQETLHFLDYWRVIRSRKEIIIAVSLLVVLTGILVTYSMPRVYRASTIIAVRQEMPDVEVFTRHATGYDPYFMRTQFEIIQSRPILEETVRKMALDVKLGNAYGYGALPEKERFDRTIRLLSRSIKVQQYRDTNLIEIQGYLSEPRDSANEEVAVLADTIAEVFRDQRIRVSREETEKAMRALLSSLEEQQKKVSELDRRVQEIREKYKINMLASGGSTDMTSEQYGLTQLEGYRRKVRVDLAEKESRLKGVTALSSNDLVAASTSLGDPVLSQMVADKRKNEVELARLLESYGEKHPKVIDMQVVVGELTAKINDALRGLKTGILLEYQAEKDKLDIIEKELGELKQLARTHASGANREFEKATEELNHARTIRDSLEARYLQEQIEMRIPRTIVEPVQPARAPAKDDPVSPDILLNVILSIIVGLGAGVALAYFVEYLDTSVKTVEDVEKYMGVPVLGVIPQRVRPLNSEDTDTAHSEAYRILRTNLRFSKRAPGGKVFSVTSGSAGEGKSLTLFNLAYVSARLGEKVLIVDSDLHRPTQHKILGVSKDQGLANVLVGEKEASDVIQHTAMANLDLMPSGKLGTGHHGLLDTVRMKQLINELKGLYDLVLFDGPPITGVSDASLLAREVDGVLLVVQHRKHPKAVSNRAKAMVENVGATVVGVVLNNINISRDYSYYYYGHYYSYAYTRSRPQDEANPKA